MTGVWSRADRGHIRELRILSPELPAELRAPCAKGKGGSVLRHADIPRAAIASE